MTLTELAVVLALISLIISGLVLSSSGIRKNAVAEKIYVFVRDFKHAIGRYYNIYGNYPQSLDDNQFVPRFLSSTAVTGFRFNGYSSSDSSCDSNPSISISVDNTIVVEMLREKGVRICRQSSDGLTLTLEVKP